MIAIKRASEHQSDPINVVKLMLDHPQSKVLIELTDAHGNLPLHIAAGLKHIPLALSFIYAKTPAKARIAKNKFSNTPLSVALIKSRMENALFLLQTCDDPQMIQDTVRVYQAYIDMFTKNNVRFVTLNSLGDNYLESIGDPDL